MTTLAPTPSGNFSMTTYQITTTEILDRRANGELAFFRGTVSHDGREARITVRSRKGEAAQYRVEDGALIPVGVTAAETLRTMLAQAAGRDDAHEEARQRLRESMQEHMEAIVRYWRDHGGFDQVYTEDVVRRFAAAYVARAAERGRAPRGLAPEGCWPSVEVSAEQVADDLHFDTRLQMARRRVGLA